MRCYGMNSCKGCKWHDEFSWACCNGDSLKVGDFVNDGCEYYERQDVHEDNGCDRDTSR